MPRAKAPRVRRLAPARPARSNSFTPVPDHYGSLGVEQSRTATTGIARREGKTGPSGHQLHRVDGVIHHRHFMW